MKRFLLALFCFCVSGVVIAEQTVDLYQAKSLVKSQSERQRVLAAKVMLENVLIRVSGRADVADNTVVQSALRRTKQYIYEYSYAQTDELIESAQGEVIPASLLIIKYSPAQIEQLLRDAGLPFWPANRPSVLVWVVANQAGGLEVINNEETWKLLQNAAELRGLPIMSPVFDLEDHLAVSAKTLWDIDERTIRQASERYNTDAILVVRYSTLSSGNYRANWQLMYDQEGQTFDGTSSDLGGLLGRTMNTVTNHFSALYAINANDTNARNITMRIENISEFSDYKRIEQYLTSLALIRRVQIGRVAGSTIILQLFTDGDIARLEHTLALGGQLIPEAASSVSLPSNRYLARGTPSSPLLYRLAEQ